MKLKDIQPYCSRENFAGNTHIKCVPIEWIEEFPEFLDFGHNYVDEIKLKSGRDWLTFPCAIDSIDFEDKERVTSQGTITTGTINGFIPGDTPDIAMVLNDSKAYEWVVVLHYKTGEMKVLGSLDYPARFTSSLSNRGALNNGKGYNFEFWSSSGVKSCFYLKPKEVKPLPFFYINADLILSYRQINPNSNVAFRVVRAFDFVEKEIGFVNGWADFDDIKNFSLGGEVRLVGYTDQNIGYSFHQTIYARCANILDSNGDWYYDDYGNKSFYFHGSAFYDLVDIDRFRLTTKRKMTFSYLHSDRKLSVENTIFGKGNYYVYPNVNSRNMGCSYSLANINGFPVLRLNYSGLNYIDVFLSQLSVFSINLDELMINSTEGLETFPVFGVNCGLNGNSISFIVGKNTVFSFANVDGYYKGMLTELIAWDADDLSVYKSIIKGNMLENYNYGS